MKIKFLFSTHMSQEEKEITETSKKLLLSAFSRGKGLKKTHKNDQHFRILFFFPTSKAN